MWYYQFSFFDIQLPPLARRQITKQVIANPDADQAQGGVADGGSHAADLTVFAFGEFQTKPAGWNGFAETNGWCAGLDFWLGIKEPGTASERFLSLDGDALGESI
jgi:hypothetical protein